MRAPDQEDERLADFWSKLLGGAARGHFDQALEALAVLLDAAHIGLVRSGAAAPDFGGDCVLAYDGRPLPGLPFGAHCRPGCEQGTLALVRERPGARDLLVVLRPGAPFQQHELAWLRLVLPHLRAGLEIADRLAAPMASMAGAAEFPRIVPTPCLLTDEAGRCIESNEAFTRTLPSLSGALRTSRVLFTEPALQDEWRRALQEAHATATTQSLLAKSSSGSQWKVYVVPFARTAEEPGLAPRHLMLVFFERIAAGALHTKTVPSVRPLTKAELEVLAGLLLGRTAKVIARERGASVNTVRSQITSILGKTEHRTQKELIAAFSNTGFESIIEEDEFDPE
jgi:DNA-binding CsgD family transcriptional regulator